MRERWEQQGWSASAASKSTLISNDKTQRKFIVKRCPPSTKSVSVNG